MRAPRTARTEGPGPGSPYRQEAFPAAGTARNVIEAGASVTSPAVTRAAVKAGRASPTSVNALPFSSTDRLSRSRDVRV